MLMMKGRKKTTKEKRKTTGEIVRQRRRSHKGFALFISLALLLLVPMSCKDDNEPLILSEPVSLVAFYQGSPNSPDLDIAVDSRQINFYPFEYADYTGYLRVYTGDRNLQFGPYAANNVAIDTTLTFEVNGVYSVFVADEYDEVSLVMLNDNSEPLAMGKTKVRVINLSPDASVVDFLVQDESQVLASNLPFKVATEFTEMNAGNYDFVLRSAGDNSELLTVPDITLQGRYFYTVIIRGYKNPPNGNNHVLSAQVVIN